MTAPLFRSVAEHGLMVDFTARGDAAHRAVLALDAALSASPFPGLLETVPALVTLLVEFDPELQDHAGAEAAISRLLGAGLTRREPPREHLIPVCYDAPFAPDLAEVASQTGLSLEAVIAAHLGAECVLSMYGFAPGYGYLSGLPKQINLPRKPSAIRNVPAGSVVIAAGQCLITTLTMPTGWWIIGRSPAKILTGNPERPFLFEVGDRIRFCRISAEALSGVAE